MEPDVQETPAQAKRSLDEAAKNISGLLDDDGHFNPDDTVSRGHPEFEPGDPETDAPQPRDDKGRFTAKQPEDEPPADPPIEEPDDELPQAADTETEVTESDQQTPTEEADTDDAPIETLAQLADALDMSIDDLGANLTHSFKAAGEDVTVTLAELQTGYQKEADYRRSTAKLAEERRTFETEQGERMKDLQAQAVAANHVVQVAEQLLAAELNSERMNQLRADDPAEWSIRKDEIMQRAMLLRQARDQAAAGYHQFTKDEIDKLRDRELKALGDDWDLNSRDAVRSTLESFGFSADEISQVFDSRMVKGVLELHGLREENAKLKAQIAKATQTATRVKQQVPKLQRPGKQVSPEAAKVRVDRDKRARLQKRLQKTGKVDDAAALIEGMNII